MNAHVKFPDFLSRLCGGEHRVITLLGATAFLNRLCGGEHTSSHRLRGLTFLSRLCGGERQNFA